MSLIEQAAKRLEALRRAGAETADPNPPPIVAEDTGTAGPERVPTPEAAIRGLGTRSPLSPERRPVVVERRSTASKTKSRMAPAGLHSNKVLEINLERLRSLGFVTPDAPRSQIADEFRVIKRHIIRNAVGGDGVKVHNGNLVMVTSALPGEGKTFTAVNLALSIAMELDTTVLLVDGDVSHPDFPNVLGVRNSPGLLELLTRDDVDVGDALVRTNIENLSVLPAGSHHRRATELLASEQMAILVRELGSRYPDRIVVFDSPPLLATTEARVLATHVGQVVMVVAADSTRQHAVNLALGTIERCEIVLMMLNKADKTDVGAYYGYYAHDEPA